MQLFVFDRYDASDSMFETLENVEGKSPTVVLTEWLAENDDWVLDHGDGVKATDFGVVADGEEASYIIFNNQ